MKIDDIEEFSLGELKNAKYIKTARATYRQSGIKKDWEIVKAHDSVAVLIYHETKRSLVLVRQFRPAVYVHNKNGVTLELCAGIVDKPSATLKRIAKEEVLEECGYEVDVDDLEKISTFYTSVGFAGSLQHLYFTKVDNSMRKSDGGGVDDELIDVVYLSIDQLDNEALSKAYALTPGLLYAICWFKQRYKGLLDVRAS